MINNKEETISIEDFIKIKIQVGTVVRVETFPEARKPAFKLWINFGEKTGVKKSSAQITANYTPETLLNKKVMAVVNLTPRQIGTFLSEVLVLGFADNNDGIVLAVPDLENVPDGAQLI